MLKLWEFEEEVTSKGEYSLECLQEISNKDVASENLKDILKELVDNGDVTMKSNGEETTYQYR